MSIRIVAQLLLWSAVVAAKPVAAEDRFDILSACATSAGHADQRACLARREAESRDLLTGAQRRLVAQLRAADQEDVLKRSAVHSTQKDAQLFLAYAARHCEVFAALAFGGNSQDDRRRACRIELYGQRTDILQKVAASVH